MRLIVSGTRDCKKSTQWIRTKIFDAINQFRINSLEIIRVATGESGKVDLVAKRSAKDAGYPYKGYKANWTEEGRAAGPLRNQKLARWGTHLVAVWDGKSRGTKNMIDEAEKAGIPEENIIVYNYGKQQTRKTDR